MTHGNLMTPDRSFLPLNPFRLFQTTPMRLLGTPMCDIYETENELVMKMELPDVKKEEVHVTLENNLLTIRGERKLEEKIERENFYRHERNHGEFLRSFTLPTFVDGEKIFAEFKQGLLTITLPKNTEAIPKQIEVKLK